MWLPAGLYLGLHLIAPVTAPALWGADVFTYYSPSVSASFVGLALLAAAAAFLPLPDWLRGAAASVPRPRHLLPFLGLAAIPVFYLFRDRTHTLGDSVKWFAVVENAVLHHRPFSELTWHNASVGLPGLEFLNFQQALDLLVHVGAFAIGRGLFDWTSIETYEWVSCLAGGLYLPVLWLLAGRLVGSGAVRVTLFLFLSTLGSIQLFFGYGESYTLVTLLSAVYLWTALDALAGRRPIWLPAVVLAVAVATHMLAISLAPSGLYLAWRHPRLGPWLRQRRVHLPVLVLGLALAAVVYDGLYRDLHLPLLTPDEEGRYALLSLAHLGTLANELLLLSPFGATWGVICLGLRIPGTPIRTFLGLTAAGAALLVGVHDITMGGRDWDLMSFPALFYSVWGFECLRSLLPEHAHRLVLRAVLPVAALHAVLWVGVNNDQHRSLARLENLMRGTVNQSTHYSQWALGYFYMEVIKNRPAEAERAFAAAIAAAPADQLDTPGTRTFSYRKFHASTLVRIGRYPEALAAIREVYRLQEKPYLGASDLALHWDWARITNATGEDSATRGDTAAARDLWLECSVALERIVAWQHSPSAHADLALVLNRLGRYREAIAYRARGMRTGEDPVTVMIDLGDTHLQAGRSGLAAFAYSHVLAAAGQLTAAEYVRVGSRLDEAGDPAGAARAFDLALAAEPGTVVAGIDWLVEHGLAPDTAHRIHRYWPADD